MIDPNSAFVDQGVVVDNQSPSTTTNLSIDQLTRAITPDQLDEVNARRKACHNGIFYNRTLPAIILLNGALLWARPKLTSVVEIFGRFRSGYFLVPTMICSIVIDTWSTGTCRRQYYTDLMLAMQSNDTMSKSNRRISRSSSSFIDDVSSDYDDRQVLDDDDESKPQSTAPTITYQQLRELNRNQQNRGVVSTTTRRDNGAIDYAELRRQNREKAAVER